MLFIEEKSPTTHYDFYMKWVVGGGLQFIFCYKSLPFTDARASFLS